jgi:hypothetical protein
MAIIKVIHCLTCNQDKEELCAISDNPHECRECKALHEKLKEQKWKATRETMDMKERMRDIEDFMYRHSQKQHYTVPRRLG